MRVLIRYKTQDISTNDCCEISCIDNKLSIFEPLLGSDEVRRVTFVDLREVSYFQIVDDLNF